ncbi:hypothetical protein B2J93_6496 [Marssonina coronariae]|uniref:Uncharacterized protein n=1 Tax=Diplocarpon coronariae TaxID=2795749 RepID=A0A218Z556_9HELO|nr:hypothetical protein B2J93_6496 [Marssonina coronariae]
MRAAATSPSLAKSNASRQDLASLQDARAATLLTRVAINSSAQQPGGYRRQGSDNEHGSPSSTKTGHEMRKEPFEVMVQQSGNYFSFPSFEDFQEYRQQSERDQNGVD